jgi:hypothetical protein
MTTQKQIRTSFWAIIKETMPEYLKEYKASKRQNEYFTDIRVSFTNYIDMLAKDGTISEKLAHKVTL